MKISTHYIYPGEAVSCVGVCFIQSHDMSEVGELGVLLLKANLHTRSISAKHITLSAKKMSTDIC